MKLALLLAACACAGPRFETARFDSLQSGRGVVVKVLVPDGWRSQEQWHFEGGHLSIARDARQWAPELTLSVRGGGISNECLDAELQPRHLLGVETFAAVTRERAVCDGAIGWYRMERVLLPGAHAALQLSACTDAEMAELWRIASAIRLYPPPAMRSRDDRDPRCNEYSGVRVTQPLDSARVMLGASEGPLISMFRLVFESQRATLLQRGDTFLLQAVAFRYGRLPDVDFTLDAEDEQYRLTVVHTGAEIVFPIDGDAMAAAQRVMATILAMRRD